MDDSTAQRSMLYTQMGALITGVKKISAQVSWEEETADCLGKDGRGRPDFFAHTTERVYMMRTLGNDIVQLMQMCDLTPTKREWQMIRAAVCFLGSVFAQHGLKEGWTFQDVGFDTFIQFFIDLFYNNFVDSDILTVRYEYVRQVIILLHEVNGCTQTYHFVMEALTVKIKSALVRIHKRDINTDYNGMTNTIDVEVLFKYFQLIEVVMLPSMTLTNEELFRLQSIERTTARALQRHTTIVFATSRLATLGKSSLADSQNGK